jgi:hypothetical protein
LNTEARAISHVQLIGLKERSIIIALLITLFCFLVLPIYQAAVNRELTLSSSSLKNELIEQDEYERLLLSYITKQSLPEVASQEALNLDLSFQKLLFKDAKYVVMKEDAQ